jgi:hypothetical protein
VAAVTGPSLPGAAWASLGDMVSAIVTAVGEHLNVTWGRHKARLAGTAGVQMWLGSWHQLAGIFWRVGTGSGCDLGLCYM